MEEETRNHAGTAGTGTLRISALLRNEQNQSTQNAISNAKQQANVQTAHEITQTLLTGALSAPEETFEVDDFFLDKFSAISNAQCCSVQISGPITSSPLGRARRHSRGRFFLRIAPILQRARNDELTRTGSATRDTHAQRGWPKEKTQSRHNTRSRQRQTKANSLPPTFVIHHRVHRLDLPSPSLLITHDDIRMDTNHVTAQKRTTVGLN